MKVLFDTNVYVSESLVGKAAEEVIAAALEARYRIFTSNYILDETHRIFTEKLKFSAHYATCVCDRVRRRCMLADPPPSRHQVPGDPADSPILNAAIHVGVDFLITGDRHLLRLNPYQGVRIVSVNEFATHLRNDGLLR